MKEIILEGDTISGSEWSKSYYDDEINKLPVNFLTLLEYWNAPVKIGNFTFGDFINIIKQLPDNEIEMLEALCGSSIKPYLDNLAEEIKEEPHKDKNVLYMAISKSYEVVNYKPWGGDGLEIEEGVNCRGISNELDEDKNPIYYGFDFDRWVDILHLPIRINDTAKLWHEDKENGIWPAKLTGEYKTYITLGEFIYAIFDEVAWFGCPERAEKFASELTKRGEEIGDGSRFEPFIGDKNEVD